MRLCALHDVEKPPCVTVIKNSTTPLILRYMRWRRSSHELHLFSLQRKHAQCVFIRPRSIFHHRRSAVRHREATYEEDNTSLHSAKRLLLPPSLGFISPTSREESWAGGEVFYLYRLMVGLWYMHM